MLSLFDLEPLDLQRPASTKLVLTLAERVITVAAWYYFISKEMGSVYYNQGLYDAQTVLASQVDTLTDSIAQLEKF